MEQPARRVQVVGTAEDPAVDFYRHMTDSALRRVREPAEGMFIAEGELVISRAYEAGFEPVHALMQQRWVSSLPATWPDHAPVFVAADDVLGAITGYRLHRGALAAFRRKPLPQWRHLLKASRRLVLLENLVDHTNVGLIFRSAAGLGIDGILVSPECADPLYRRAVKVSMGATLTLPWARCDPWPESLNEIVRHGWKIAALALSSDAVPLSSLEFAGSEPWALLCGSEGPGLTDAALEASTVSVQIPMHGNVDSLNVAMAAAIATYVVMGGA